jgi:hypothetical protein
MSIGSVMFSAAVSVGSMPGFGLASFMLSTVRTRWRGRLPSIGRPGY